MKEFECCHKTEHIFRPGYAFVPFQRLGKVYTPKKALMEGTIFPELNITVNEYERGLYNGK